MSDVASHSSIGEVLTLLQEDYPDITISKIRFLESQGLLNPERTPSGYRKFHDEDIERLRWILTQQRDHFLPLKVIKDRLAAGDFAEGPPEGVLPFERSDAPKRSADPSGPASSSASATDAASGDSVAPDRLEEVADSAHPASSTDADGTVAVSEPAVDEGVASESAKNRARAVSALVEGPPTQAKAAPRGRRRHPTGHTKGEPTPVVDGGVEDEAPAVALTLDELCEQSGLTASAVAELERFGLLSARSMGHVEYYDDESLVVARLAGGFGRFGIEPRHLRMYKVSAEREAGLFEQLITPLLKQRRAAARDQAVEMLEELAELADDLRAVMVRASLREYLGQS